MPARITAHLRYPYARVNPSQERNLTLPHPPMMPVLIVLDPVFLLWTVNTPIHQAANQAGIGYEEKTE